jgi:hypothetical protein
MNDELLKSIDRTLKALLGTVVSIRNDKPLALNERIAQLHDMGFKPKEISEILGRTGIYVNKELSQLRKSGRKRRKHNDKSKG